MQLCRAFVLELILEVLSSTCILIHLESDLSFSQLSMLYIAAGVVLVNVATTPLHGASQNIGHIIFNDAACYSLMMSIAK
jgi:hypothetical protein